MKKSGKACQDLADWLASRMACGPAVTWIRRSNIKSMDQAWKKCRRGDWMMWILRRDWLHARNRSVNFAAAEVAIHLLVKPVDGAYHRRYDTASAANAVRKVVPKSPVVWPPKTPKATRAKAKKLRRRVTR